VATARFYISNCRFTILFYLTAACCKAKKQQAASFCLFVEMMHLTFCGKNDVSGESIVGLCQKCLSQGHGTVCLDGDEMKDVVHIEDEEQGVKKTTAYNRVNRRRYKVKWARVH